MNHSKLGAAVTAAAAEMRKRSTHTQTNVVRIEHLPKEVQDLLLEMADRVSSHALKLAKLEKDISDLQALVAGMGQVTLNDLIRRSA